jgi:Protein of unknown function (DUF4239)
MSTLAISAIVFVCVFGGALAGFQLRTVLPEEHVNLLSRDVVKLAMGTIATMTALVLGLLVNSAKNSFDTQSRELTEMSAKIVLLDRALSHYGPEANDARQILRSAVAELIEETWPSNRPGRPMSEPSASHSEILFDKIQELAPATDTQRMLQNRALTLAVDIGQMRWLLIEQGYSPVSTPLVIVVVFSLTITFTSFGIHSPRNGTLIATVFLAALSVSGVMFLILEMYRPFGGLIQISSASIRAALAHLGH